MLAGDARKYRFAGFELDAARYALTKDGAAVAVEPLVFDLIRLFVDRPNQVLTREILIDVVWDGRIVSEATISSGVKAARRALGDTGAAQTLIRTVRGRGFEFVGAVERIAPEGSAPVAAAAAPPPREAEAPITLAVRPFRVIGDAPALAIAADGLASNLATVLTRVPLLNMVCASAEAALVVEGEVQAAEAGLRANLRLSRGGDGVVLWAQAFEQSLDEGAAARLLEAALPRLEPQLVRALYQAATAGDEPPSARRLLIRASGELALRGWTRPIFESAAALLREAIGLEPRLALAHANLALVLALGRRIGLFAEDVESEAALHAETALTLDDMDSTTIGLAGCAFADLGQTHRARPLLKRSIELNPSNAQAWTALGSALLRDRENAEAIRHLEHGLAISPMDPRRSVWGAVLALAYLRDGNAAASAAAARRAADSDDRLYLPHLALAAAQARAGDAAQARAALTAARQIKPDLSMAEIRGFLGVRLGDVVVALEIDGAAECSGP